jgi:branched-subunit amino acid aminotransferase/4-amino-4-deoxychorismate lyase
MVEGVLGPLASATIPVTDPAFTLGWSVFESMAATAGAALGLAEHLDRLERSALATRVPFPGRALLEAEVAEIIAAAGGEARLRVTLTAGGRRVLVATPLDLSRWGAPVRCVRGIHRDEPILGGRPKHASRAPWAVAVARSGVDDVLLVDADGRFTEATTAGVVAVIGGELWAAPDDGRILPSTMIEQAVLHANAAGVRVHRQGAPAVGPWDGLYVASSTRGIAPVVELDGVPLAGWEPVGRSLASCIEFVDAL